MVVLLTFFSLGFWPPFFDPLLNQHQCWGPLLRQVSLAPTGGHASDTSSAVLQGKVLAGGYKKTPLDKGEGQPWLGMRLTFFNSYGFCLPVFLAFGLRNLT